MPTYIALSRWTQKGIEAVKESPTRLDAAKQAARALGVEIKETYLVTGQYDLVIVIDAPDDETLAKFQLAAGALGNIRTETLRAFSEADYRRIIAALP